jgi:TP901 family phage tail tape measure protein
VAEALGAAVLTVSVDDTQLRAGLLAVQTEAQRTAAIVRQAFEQASQAQRQPSAARPPLPPPIPPELLRGVESYRAATVASTAATAAQGQALSVAGSSALQLAAGYGALTSALGALGVATSTLGVASYVGTQIKELDQAAAAVRTLGVDSDDLKSRLRNLSVELNNNVSQVELLKAAYDVASSGFSKPSEQVEILRASVRGAVGGFATIEDVSRGAAGVLNAYGRTTKDVGKIVDQFVQTQNDGTITVREYVNEIGNIAAVAAGAGIPIEELNALIANATNNSVPVQQTFTGLRQAIASVLKPTADASRLARSLGIDFSASAVRSKGFVALLDEIRQKGGGTPDRLFQLLGSVEAQAVVQPAINDGLKKTNQFLENQATAGGTAAKAMDINSGTIAGGLKRIGNGFSNLAATLESVVSPYFKSFIEDIDGVISRLTTLIGLLPLKQIGDFGGKVAPLASDQVLRQILGPLGLAYDFVIGGKIRDRGSKPQPQQGPPVPPRLTVKPKPPQQEEDPVVDAAKQAADLQEIRTKNALDLEGIRSRIEASKTLATLQGVERQKLENKLAVEEKIRAVKVIQADLDREMAKPVGNGITNLEGSRSATRVAQLEGNLTRAAREVELAYVQAGEDLKKATREAAATTRQVLDTFRARGDTLRSLARQGSDAITGARSPIDVLRPSDAVREAQRRVAAQTRDLGTGISDAARDAERAARALRDALDRRAGGELIPLDQLAKFRTDAETAAAKLTVAGLDVGRALRDGATDAAKQLRDAQGSFNDVVRSNADVFSPALVNEQLRLARAEIQPLIDRGLIRQGTPVQTPDQVFGLAAIARQFQQAENQLALARAQKEAADAAVRNAGALVENSTKMGLLANSLDALATKEWLVNVNVQPPTAALPGV